MLLKRLGWLLPASLALASPFLLKDAGKWINRRMEPADVSQRAQVTEYVVTEFGDPYPYRLQFVAQYRFVHQVGEFLVRRDPHQQIVGGAAESWQIAPDRKSITFHLRPGGYTAEEVAQSLRRLLRSGQTTHSNLAAQTDEKSIRVEGPTQLTLATRGDAGAILSPLVMADAVLLPDDHWIGENRIDWTRSRGPYIHRSGSFPLKPGDSAVFVPNPAHYLHQAEQVDWKIEVLKESALASLSDLQRLLERSPGFVTMRFWPRNPLFRDGGTADAASLPYFETKPNGVAFILPNRHGKLFADARARQALLKAAFNADLALARPGLRARQIAQPGLSGRLSADEERAGQDKIAAYPGYEFKSPIRWAIPQGAYEDGAWARNVVRNLGLPSSTEDRTIYPSAKEWQAGEYDATFLGVGMSDTDPISGATFLFAPTGADADLPDHSILAGLNQAKDNVDRAKITAATKQAFATALDAALIVPLHYIVNRHYHSPRLSLNIQDTFSESINIWEVRVQR
jgi:ABC-type transport system substrate-binding protein